MQVADCLFTRSDQGWSGEGLGSKLLLRVKSPHESFSFPYPKFLLLRRQTVLDVSLA